MGGGEHGHGHGAKIIHTPVIAHAIDPPHAHTAKFEAPDWRIYKVENAPELKHLQETLASKGLKDPWLRNQVWRYDPQFGYVKPTRALRNVAGRGMRNGFLLAVGVILLQTAYAKMFGSKDKHHGHH